jgi:probable HAF family extracellular repeat protein
LGINDAGPAVGHSRLSWGTDHAFITSADGIGMTDLNSLIDLLGGIILTDAVDVNNVGQVIAIDVIPEPEAYALFLAGLGPMGVIVSRNRLAV